MYLQKPLRSLFLLLFPCFLLILSSCQSDQESSTPSSEGQGTLSFTVSNYRQISFDDISSSSSTRASETVVMELANLSLTVFDAETNEMVVPTILHKSEDYDSSVEKAKTFPQFSVTLPYGHYRLLVLGYNGTKGCSIASVNHITWDDDYVPNTFLYCNEFTLDKNSNLNQSITLRHVVSAFRVTAEDAIPSELGKMRFISSAGGTVLDGTTGFTPQNTGRTTVLAVPANYAGKQGVDFTTYLFLPSEEANSNYTVQSLGKSDNLLFEKHFNDVPLRINVLTQWTGKVFEDGGDDVSEVQSGFSIGWDMNWADTLKLQP